MATQGWFNHYDDPDDEYWDQEPVHSTSHGQSLRDVTSSRILGPNLQPGPQKQPQQSYAAAHLDDVATPPTKSSLVEVELAEDGLPLRISLAQSWKSSFEPRDYGRSIIDAYNHALFVMVAGMAKSGRIPNASPTRLRDVAPLLLRTRTLSEYEQLYDAIFSLNAHEIKGPGKTDDGRPGLIVTANRSRLISVMIAPEWAWTTDVRLISQDIVDCCAQARSEREALLRRISDESHPAQLTVADILQHERMLMEREG